MARRDPGFKAKFVVTSDEFQQYKRHVRQGVTIAAERMGRRAASVAMAEMTRIRTGATRNTITSQVFLDANGNIVVVVKTGTWYGHFQDRGTKRGIVPLLFLEKGLAAATGRATEDLREAIK